MFFRKFFPLLFFLVLFSSSVNAVMRGVVIHESTKKCYAETVFENDVLIGGWSFYPLNDKQGNIINDFMVGITSRGSEENRGVIETPFGKCDLFQPEAKNATVFDCCKIIGLQQAVEGRDFDRYAVKRQPLSDFILIWVGLFFISAALPIVLAYIFGKHGKRVLRMIIQPIDSLYAWISFLSFAMVLLFYGYVFIPYWLGLDGIMLVVVISIYAFIVTVKTIFKKTKPGQMSKSAIVLFGLMVLSYISFLVSKDLFLINYGKFGAENMPSLIFIVYSMFQAITIFTLIQAPELFDINLTEFFEERIPTIKKVLIVSAIAIVLFSIQSLLGLLWFYNTLNTLAITSIIAKQIKMDCPA